MAAPTRQIERSAIQASALEITRQFLNETGKADALSALQTGAHLERDLGLGSLEKMELLARLDRFFHTSLPETALQSSDSLEDLVQALVDAIGSAPALPQPPDSPPNLIAAQPAAAPLHARTWQEVLRYRAETDRARRHLILEHSRRTQTISFQSLYRAARKIASQLIERGLRPGQTVALMLPTSEEFFFTFAGIWLAGGVPVPLYPPFRPGHIAEYAHRQSAILRNCEARFLITFKQAQLAASLLRARAPSLQAVWTAHSLLFQDLPRQGLAAPPSLPASFEPSDLALLQYTSGSTGDPKGVMLTHSNLLANVRAIGEVIGFTPHDVGVSWLPLYHDMGLIGAWLAPLYFGLPVVLLSPLAFLSRPDRWLWAIHRHRGTLTAAPNFAYELAARKIEDRDIDGLDLASLRAALNGAEPVLPETLDRFSQRYSRYGFRPEAFLPVYGLAEASLAVTFPPPGRAPLVDRVLREPLSRDRRAVAAPTLSPAGSVQSFVSVGAPLSGCEVRIADANGNDAGERVEGDLWFRGPSATRGYFRNRKATAALFPAGPESGWVNSGDRAYRAGGEIFITGRVKDIILKAGRNLYPQEIEEAAARVESVRRGCVAAFGVPQPSQGTERVVIAAEIRRGNRQPPDALRTAIARQVTQAIGLPPDEVHLLPPHSIPKTSSGKLRREETKRLYLSGQLGKPALPAWLQLGQLAAANLRGKLFHWPRRALQALHGIFVLLAFSAWILPAWLLVLLAPSRRSAERITTAALRLFFLMIGCRVQLQGAAHLKTSAPAVFVSNHTSYFDVLPLMAALGSDYHFVAKGEVARMPLIGTFLRKLGHFSFDRKDPRARIRQAVQIDAALRRGESVFLFPEGTFLPGEGVRAFHMGAFHAAVTALCPVIPIGLQGTRQFLRDATFLPRPRAVKITVCPPLFPRPCSRENAWREAVRLRDLARSAIAEASGEPLL